MNSFYGVFASGFYRFPHRRWGNQLPPGSKNIKTIIHKLGDEGQHVVYSIVNLRQSTCWWGWDPKQAMIDFHYSTAERLWGTELDQNRNVSFLQPWIAKDIWKFVWPKSNDGQRLWDPEDRFRYLTDGMKEYQTRFGRWFRSSNQSRNQDLLSQEQAKFS